MKQFRFVAIVQPDPAALKRAYSISNKFYKKYFGYRGHHIPYYQDGPTNFSIPHITLRGGTTLTKKHYNQYLNDLREIARATKPFTITLSGTQAFYQHGKPHVYCWKVQPCKALTQLEGQIHRKLQSKFPAWRHSSFNPHITLAYDSRKNSPLHKHQPENAPTMRCKITSIKIMKKRVPPQVRNFFSICEEIPLG